MPSVAGHQTCSQARAKSIRDAQPRDPSGMPRKRHVSRESCALAPRLIVDALVRSPSGTRRSNAALLEFYPTQGVLRKTYNPFMGGHLA